MRFLIMILSIAASGCATTQQANDSDYSDLYTGRSRLAFATEIPVGSSQTALNIGDQAYRNGELDKALYHYVQSIELNDSQPHAFHRIGLIHKQRGNLQLAARSFNHAVERDETHAAALEELGLIMLHDQKPKSASRFFDQVLAIDPNRARSHNGLGVIADLNGEHSQAAVRFRQALTLQPKATHIINNLGYSLYLSGDWDEAEKTYYRVLEIEQEHELALRNLALLHVRRGQHQRALGLLEKVAGDAAANNDIGYLCMLDGQHGPADRFFRAAIELSPIYYEKAHKNLAENRTLARKEAAPRLARLFTPDAASSKTKKLTTVDRELTPIIGSEPISSGTRQSAAASVPKTDQTAQPARTAPAKQRSARNGNLYLKRYVRTGTLNVRDNANESGSVLDRLHRGRVVRVLRKSGDWAYVLYWKDSGRKIMPREGWVHASFLSETDARNLS